MPLFADASARAMAILFSPAAPAKPRCCFMPPLPFFHYSFCRHDIQAVFADDAADATLITAIFFGFDDTPLSLAFAEFSPRRFSAILHVLIIATYGFLRQVDAQPLSRRHYADSYYAIFFG
jgi:hypothetical protein